MYYNICFKNSLFGFGKGLWPFILKSGNGVK